MSALAGILKAEVLETLPNSRYLCRAEDGSELFCHVSGHARMTVVRVLPGDDVLVEPSSLDPGKGRIVGKPAAGRGR